MCFFVAQFNAIFRDTSGDREYQMHNAKSDLSAVLQACLDKGEEGLTTSWDEVNAPMIRHWAQAMGDHNPIYTDAAFASNTRHGGLVAPPTMLQAWTMKGLQGPAPGTSATDPLGSASTAIADAGYGAVVATNCEQVYLRYVRPGERLHHKSRLESISDEKKTGLGTGFFLTQLSEYFTEEGETVAEMRFTILCYKPAELAPKSPPPDHPGMTRDIDFFWQGLHEDNSLLIQRCLSCKALRHPTSPACPKCRSLEHDTVEASGRATLCNYVTMHQPLVPLFEHVRTVALVELEEGIQLLAGLVDSEQNELEKGAPLQLEAIQCDMALNVPMFRKAGQGMTMATQENDGVFFAEVAVGDQLPALEIDITTLMIVSTAIASRDYQDVHHDKDRAQELGSPDIFMNILTSNGLVGRYVTDWAGPEAILTAVKIRLGAPNYPGDKMVMRGDVIAKRAADGKHVVDLAVVGENSMGAHVSGTVTVDLLKSEPESE